MFKLADWDVEVDLKQNPKGWAVETLTCLHCGETAVNVYPAHLESIECKCGHWMMTHPGELRADVERSN